MWKHYVNINEQHGDSNTIQKCEQECYCMVTKALPARARREPAGMCHRYQRVAVGVWALVSGGHMPLLRPSFISWHNWA